MAAADVHRLGLGPLARTRHGNGTACSEGRNRRREGGKMGAGNRYLVVDVAALRADVRGGARLLGRAFGRAPRRALLEPERLGQPCGCAFAQALHRRHPLPTARYPICRPSMTARAAGAAASAAAARASRRVGGGGTRARVGRWRRLARGAVRFDADLLQQWDQAGQRHARMLHLQAVRVCKSPTLKRQP